MTNFQNVYQYKSKYFTPSALNKIADNFLENYQRAIKFYAHKPFIKVYANGTELQKSFTEFDQDVRFTASQIQSLPAKGSVLITISMNTYEHLIYITAAWLCGKTVCPINPNDSLERIRTKIGLIPDQHSIWSDQLTILEGIDQCKKMTSPLSVATNQFAQIPKNNPMLLVFTSGSTGYSKIVEQMETNIISNVEALILHHKLNEHEIIATSLPIFHVNALEFSFLCSLLSGSKFILYDKFSLPIILKSLAQDQVTILSVVPTILKLMLDRKTSFLKINLEKLKYVVTAAAPLSKKVAQDFLDTFRTPLIQGYGLSEAVNFSLKLPTDLTLEEYRHWLCNYPHPSSGVPLFGNDITLLNENSEIKEEGVIGEICIRGFNVMRSYLSHDPSVLFKDGFLHTGDLGYFHYSHDGKKFFFISGRSKEIIKNFGETVSLREVDDIVLSFLPKDHDAISVGFSNELAGEELALVITGDWPQIELDQFVFNLSKLPTHLCPKVVAITSAPLRTGSGKPQRWHFSHFFTPYLNSTFYQKAKPIIIRPLKS